MLKRCGNVKQKRGLNIKEGILFFYHQLKLMSHFVPVTLVSPDTTLKERCLG